jgi:hypothetical protein
MHVRLFGRTIFKRTRYGNWYLILPGWTLSKDIRNPPDTSRPTLQLQRRYRGGFLFQLQREMERIDADTKKAYERESAGRYGG